MISNPRIIDVGNNTSFYKFISTYCVAEANGKENRAFHRLCSLARKMNVKHAVIEDVDTASQLVATECQALKNYHGCSLQFSIYRITLLSADVTQLLDLQSLPYSSFLSSTIIINYQLPDSSWKSYLFFSIVTTPKAVNKDGSFLPLLNNYLHVYKIFECEVGLSGNNFHKFEITGSYFCQQNSETNVCAHASLCMIINNMDLTVSITNEDINTIIGVDHIRDKLGSTRVLGLTKEEIIQVLNRYNLSFQLKDYFYTNHEENYNDFIYKYIESKYPALLVFTTAGDISHIVPVFGHTLNTDMWRPEAELTYIKPNNILNYRRPASAFVDHFLMHDDNFGMYFSLPADALNKVTLPKYDPSFRIYYAIVIIPDGVTTPSWEAEWASIVILNTFLQIGDQNSALDDWSKRLFKRERPWVVRSFLVKKAIYAKSIESPDYAGSTYTPYERDQILDGLPDLFWLTEVSLPDLYSANKTKIVDVFYPSDCSPLTDNSKLFSRWIQIRLPNVLARRTTDSNFTPTQLTLMTHFPLLRFDSTLEMLDW